MTRTLSHVILLGIGSHLSHKHHTCIHAAEEMSCFTQRHTSIYFSGVLRLVVRPGLLVNVHVCVCANKSVKLFTYSVEQRFITMSWPATSEQSKDGVYDVICMDTLIRNISCICIYVTVNLSFKWNAYKVYCILFIISWLNSSEKYRQYLHFTNKKDCLTRRYVRCFTELVLL